MFESWKIGIVYAATSNIAKVMGEASRATILTNEQLKQQNSVLKQRAAQEAKLRSQIAQTQAIARVATVGFGALAAASGAALYSGIRGAADLESAMVGIGIATDATRSQMERLRETAFSVSAQTAQSVVDSARVMQVIANNMKGMPHAADKVATLAGPMALFADVQFLKSHGQTSFEDATKQAMGIAHLYQRYGVSGNDDIRPILDQLTKLSFMMPDNLNQYLTQAGYYMPVFRRLGVDPTQSLIAGAFIDRMGIGRGKGGTGLQRFLLEQLGPLQMTRHQQGGQRNALIALGLLNPDGTPKFYSGGHFDLIGSLEAINDKIDQRTKGLTGHARDAAQIAAIKDIQSALKTTGARIGFLAEPGAVQQLHNMVNALRDPNSVGMAEAQSRYMNTLNGRFQQFRTNFSSLLTELMYPWLGRLKDAFGFAANKLHEWQVWLHQNKDAEKRIGAALFATFIGSVSAVGATSVAAAKRVWDLQRAILALSVTGGPGIPGGGGTTGKVGFIAKAKGFIWGALNWFTFGIPGLVVGAIKKWHGAIQPAIVRVTDQILSKFLDQIGKIAKVGPALVDALLPFENALVGLVSFVTKLLGPISWILSLTGDTPQDPNAIQGHSLQFWQKFLKTHPGYNAPDDVKNAVSRVSMDGVKPGITVVMHQPQFYGIRDPKAFHDDMNRLGLDLQYQHFGKSRSSGPLHPTHPTTSRYQFQPGH